MRKEGRCDVSRPAPATAPPGLPTGACSRTTSASRARSRSSLRRRARRSRFRSKGAFRGGDGACTPAAPSFLLSDLREDRGVTPARARCGNSAAPHGLERGMVARIAAYRAAPGAVEPLIEEIVTVARARSPWPARRTERRAELFFINTRTGDGLSLVVGDDAKVRPVIELRRPPSKEPEEYDVHLLQIAAP